MPRHCNGGDRGNSYDRRNRKLWLLGAIADTRLGFAPFGGDGEKVPCVHCGKILTESTVESDRILPGSMGGRYTRDNVQPSCRPCNASRGDSL